MAGATQAERKNPQNPHQSWGWVWVSAIPTCFWADGSQVHLWKLRSLVYAEEERKTQPPSGRSRLTLRLTSDLNMSGVAWQHLHRIDCEEQRTAYDTYKPQSWQATKVTLLSHSRIHVDYMCLIKAHAEWMGTLTVIACGRQRKPL